jgi:hypothetical protein
MTRGIMINKAKFNDIWFIVDLMKHHKCFSNQTRETAKKAARYLSRKEREDARRVQR